MLSDCEKCWETPCVCGHDYRSWSKAELTQQIQMLQDVLNSKLDKDDEFQYVAASLWYPDKPVNWDNLNIYTYGCQVQTGTISNADYFREYVDRNSKASDKDKNNKSKIYRIFYREIKKNGPPI